MYYRGISRLVAVLALASGPPWAQAHEISSSPNYSGHGPDRQAGRTGPGGPGRPGDRRLRLPQ
jgi:hypothetical protein